MKSNLLKLYIFAFLFIGDFVMFAQDEPGDCQTVDCDPTDCENTLEGCDPPAASINPKLIWLAILGISFAIYYFNRRKEEKAL
ncbi:hypothetical protein [Flavobacterium sp.]|uniref:hypothetical protein n=1 Tax=Flavobacterium sp. TaxID=239 RepID=UPI0040344CE4